LTCPAAPTRSACVDQPPSQLTGMMCCAPAPHRQSKSASTMGLRPSPCSSSAAA
jgi:hypothetical protein